MSRPMTDKEHPILFTGPMVRAILRGEKTQTRRVVVWRRPLWEGLLLSSTSLQAGHYCTGEPQHGWVLRSRDGAGVWNDRTRPEKCPYGQPGDRLWVRETYALACEGGSQCGVQFAADEDQCPHGVADWKPSIFMPRWAARLTLDVTGVRVERVQDISEADALAEGIHQFAHTCYSGGEHTEYGYHYEYNTTRGCQDATARAAYARLWDSLNTARGFGWDANPWVWVITFRPAPKGETPC